MGDYTELTILAADKAGDQLNADASPLMVGADTQATDGFDFINDGNVVLLVIDAVADGAGDTLIFEAVNDPYGRPEETLARTITAAKAYIYGPFLPLIWNQSDGTVRCKFETANAKTTIIAIRVANPT